MSLGTTPFVGSRIHMQIVSPLHIKQKRKVGDVSKDVIRGRERVKVSKVIRGSFFFAQTVRVHIGFVASSRLQRIRLSS